MMIEFNDARHTLLDPDQIIQASKESFYRAYKIDLIVKHQIPAPGMTSTNRVSFYYEDAGLFETDWKAIIEATTFPKLAAPQTA